MVWESTGTTVGPKTDHIVIKVSSSRGEPKTYTVRVNDTTHNRERYNKSITRENVNDPEEFDFAPPRDDHRGWYDDHEQTAYLITFTVSHDDNAFSTPLSFKIVDDPESDLYIISFQAVGPGIGQGD